MGLILLVIQASTSVECATVGKKVFAGGDWVVGFIVIYRQYMVIVFPTRLSSRLLNHYSTLHPR